jgi:hypothetical protein
MKKGTEMSEIEIGMEVLTMLSHLKNGKIGDAIARFAEEFRFKDHGIGLEFKDKDCLAEFFHQDTGTLPGLFLADGHDVREWRPRDHRMDASSHVDGAFLRRTRTKGPSLLAGVSIVRTANGKITD